MIKIPEQFTPKIFTLLKQGYGWKDARADVLAGLTVAIVALPLSMALAIASGASPDKGLITSIVAGFLISLLGGSRVQIGGPTGAFVVVVFNVIAAHGYDGLLLATFMAGLIMIIAGYARLGQIIKFIPHPVVTGFTAGIAVTIASSQVKDFLGLQIQNLPADFLPKWSAIFDASGTLNVASLGLGLVALLAIVALRRYAPKLPGYLIVVALASLAAYGLRLPVETIGQRFPNIPSGLPTPEFPHWNLALMKEVIPSAFTIAFLAGIEALLSAMVADGMTGYRHRSNQELVGQGFANLASALFTGLPATGAIARTATNIKSGGKTPFAGMFHAVFILLFMLYLSDVMAFVPLCVLAAILFVVAWGMSEVRHFVHIARLPASDRGVMVLTFALTVMVDLTVAIAVGVTLASLLFMKQMSASVAMRAQAGQTIDASTSPSEDPSQRQNLPKGVEAFRIVGPLFFGVASDLLDTLKNIGRFPKVLILRVRHMPYIDVTGLKSLQSLISDCQKQGTIIIFSDVQAQPYRLLTKSGITASDTIVFAPSYREAIEISATLTGSTGAEA